MTHTCYIPASDQKWSETRSNPVFQLTKSDSADDVQGRHTSRVELLPRLGEDLR